MAHLLSMGIKMQITTTTTTTTAAVKTVQYNYDNGFCTGRSGSVIKNGSSIFSGTVGSGTFTVVPGDVITISDTTGPKATGLLCTAAHAAIGSTLGGAEYGVNNVTGVNVTATVTYTITSGTASTIYMEGGASSF